MFQRILVGFDGTPAARSALRFATLLAAPDASMTVATVTVERLATGFATGIDAVTGVAESERALLEEARDLLGHRAGVSYEAPVGPSVAAALRTIAADDESDLLVVGTSRHHGVQRIIAGSDAEETLRGAPCAVCVVPRTAPDALRRIAVASDGSDLSQAVIDAGSMLADGTEAALTVLTVVDGERPRDDPAKQLLSAAEEIDLLVLGARGSSPVLPPLHGNVAETVTRRATCPVLLVPRTPEDARTTSVAEQRPVRRGVSW